MRLLIGAATTVGEGSPASGISIAVLAGDGGLNAVGAGAEGVENPMYLALSADRRTVYIAHEAASGQVSAWRLVDDQLLSLGPSQSTGGAITCHLSVGPDGRHLLAADYGSGSVSVHRIGADGSLAGRSDVVQLAGAGPNRQRQAGPHAHMVISDPNARRGHVLVADLGSDRLHRYTLTADTGILRAVDSIPIHAGAGPRHLVVRGDLGYVVNELDSTVSVVDLEAAAVVATVPTHAGDPVNASQPSAIRLSADARFLYVANRGVDEIAVLTVDGPRLELVAAVPCGGVHPRDLALDPSGQYLVVANQFSDAVVSFRIDAATGVPTQVATMATPSPTCLVFS